MDTRTARVLAVPARARLLELMREADAACTVAGLAEAAGLHVNTTRVHLERLVGVGFAERVNGTASGPGRPATLYRASPVVDESSTGHGYRELAAVLADELAAVRAPERAAERAGARWAHAIEQADWPLQVTDAAAAMPLLVDLLDRLGFAPRTEPLGDRIYLGACPFLEVARHNPAIVCGVHKGLLAGAIQRLGAPLTITRVDPFVHDDLCVIHLAATTA